MISWTMCPLRKSLKYNDSGLTKERKVSQKEKGAIDDSGLTDEMALGLGLQCHS